MEKRSVALRQVSEAINLESSGFQQAAFVKYLQSLQALSFYLNDLYASLGLQKMFEKRREITQVLCMIHECSDRIAVIVDADGKSTDMTVQNGNINSSAEISIVENAVSTKFYAFQKMQEENMFLLKNYQRRLERVNDNSAKTNLKLELERRLAENAIVAKTKYEMAVKQLQKERVQMMERAIRNLFETERNLSEKEKEKQELYKNALQYAKTEIWPCSWKLNSYELSASEAAEKIFHKIIRCSGHPLSQWLMLTQMNTRREIDKLFNQYSDYLLFLPDHSTENVQKFNVCDEKNGEIIVISSRTGETAQIPLSKMASLHRSLKTISSDITNVIGNTLQIFYLIYKSLLPDDSETICYNIIEKYVLDPIWLKLLTLYRILNLQSENKISKLITIHENSGSSIFGITYSEHEDTEFISQSILLLKTLQRYRSLVEKLRILVQVSQIICKDSPAVEENSRKHCGAEELISRLCYIIIKSKIPQLVSECHAIEQLFDMKFMLGEEGYALSSFLTALKYIEIKELAECKDSEEDELNN